METRYLFTMTPAHIQLLKHMRVGWAENESDPTHLGAPAIKRYRTYGNADIGGDLARLLAPLFHEPLTREEMECIHRETQIALQIVLITGCMQEGTYMSPSPEFFAGETRLLNTGHLQALLSQARRSPQGLRLMRLGAIRVRPGQSLWQEWWDHKPAEEAQVEEKLVVKEMESSLVREVRLPGYEWGLLANLLQESREHASFCRSLHTAPPSLNWLPQEVDTCWEEERVNQAQPIWQELVRLLDALSDHFGNHICDDGNFASWIPDLAMRQIIMKRYHEYNGDPESFEEDTKYGETYQWGRSGMLTWYLARRIEVQFS